MTTTTETLILEVALRDNLMPGILAQADAFDQLSAASRGYEDQVKGGLGMDELAKRIANTNDTIIEYGGTIEDVEKSHVALGVAAAQTGKPIALLTKLQEKLADEADDGAAAHKHLGGALKLLENSYLKAEDAGAAYGRLVRGETDVLKELGAAGDRLHKSLEGITDAQLRGKLGAKAMEAAIASNASLTQKYANTVQSARARLDIFTTKHRDLVTALKAGEKAAELAARGLNGLGSVAGKALKATGAAALTAAAAIGGGLVKAVTSYFDKSVALAKQKKALTKAFDKFIFTVGGTIVKTGGLDKIMVIVTKTFGRLTKWVEKNQVQIGEWVRGFLKGATLVARGAVFIAGGVGRFIAVIGDLIAGLARKFVKFFDLGDLFIQAAGPLQDFLGLSDEAAASMVKMGMAMRDFGKQEAFTFDFATKADSFFGDVETGVNSLLDEVDGALASRGAEMEKVGRVRIGRMVGEGAVTELQKILLEAAQKKVMQSMPAFANLALQVVTGADKVNVELAKHRAMADQYSKTIDVLKSKNLGDAFAAEFQKGIDKNKEWKAAGIDPVNDGLEVTIQKLREMENLKFFTGEMSGALEGLTSGVMDLTGALLSGQLALKDLGGAVADMVGDVIMQSGKNLMMYALTSAGVFKAFGAAFAALGTMSPTGLFLGGGLLFAAGAGLKAFLGSGSGGGTSSQARADSSTASTVERMGRHIMDQGADQGPREMTVMVGDRQMSAWAVDTMDDRRSRREGLAPATGVLD